MKYITALMLSSFLSFNSQAGVEDCYEIVLSASSSTKIILADHMVRRTREELLSSSWPYFVDQIYIQSSQGQTVSPLQLQQMDSSVSNQVQSLKEMLEPNFGSGVKIDAEAIIHNIDQCLPQEIKGKCIESLETFNFNMRDFSKNNSLLLSNMKSFVTSIETLNSEVQQTSSAGQIYSTERAYNFKNNFTGIIRTSTNLKSAMNNNAGTIESLKRNQLYNCFFND